MARQTPPRPRAAAASQGGRGTPRAAIAWAARFARLAQAGRYWPAHGGKQLRPCGAPGRTRRCGSPATLRFPPIDRTTAMTADNVDSLLCGVGEVSGQAPPRAQGCLRRSQGRHRATIGSGPTRHRGGPPRRQMVRSTGRVLRPGMEDDPFNGTSLRRRLRCGHSEARWEAILQRRPAMVRGSRPVCAMARLPAVRPNCRCRECRVYRATAICGLTDSAVRLAACERRPLREGRARLAKRILRRPQRRAQ